jgi:diaminopimelate epimerase
MLFLKGKGGNYMYFVKMHGLGNDFIVLENMGGELNKQNIMELAKKMCNRHFGIGADGLLIVEKSQIADTKMLIINSDGSTAEMCGNGVRCFAKYIYEKGIVKKNKINIETLAGIMHVDLILEESALMGIKVNMGSPKLDKKDIPFSSSKSNIQYMLNIDGEEYRASTLLLGVPHTIIFVDEIDVNKVIEVGRKIENLDLYPSRTNVNFVRIIDRKHIELRTWERGAGYTLACGTGTCASVVACILAGKTDNYVEAELAGGKLLIEYNDNDVYMTGPAESVFEGEINI